MLSEIVAGDKVLAFVVGTGWQPFVVARTTKRKIILADGREFSRLRGTEIGKPFITAERIMPLTGGTHGSQRL
jgi:hypothetical protein